MFESEYQMSQYFESFICSTFGTSYFKEFQGLFGIPDFVVYEKSNHNISIVSFELKLRNWRKAAKQAFRYKSFSNISYVVLANSHSNPATNNLNYFRQYNIGLAIFDERGNFEILFKPKNDMPYSQAMMNVVVEQANKKRMKARNVNTLAI